MILLDFHEVLNEIRTSFRDKDDIIHQYIVDCERSNILINNKEENYKYLSEYILENTNQIYDYDYLISMTQALLSIPYVILMNSTNKFVGELNNQEKKINQ